MQEMTASQKLLAPSVHRNTLKRSRLLARAGESQVGIINIVAAAGFGKTVLLSQLADLLDQPVIWYQLDENDNDPAVFWRCFIEGCKTLHSDFGMEILSFIDSNPAGQNRGKTVLALLQKELSRNQGGVILVFDDCHMLRQTEIIAFFEELLHQLPPFVKVLMAGRTDVFQLRRLIFEGKVHRLDIDDLYFTREEITNYFAISGTLLTGAELDIIESSTEGWPLAVSLSLSSPSRRKECIGRPDKKILFDYMVSEILAGEKSELYRFLTVISVLDEITPEYCDRLLDRTDSKEILAFLQGKYFFLTPFVGKDDTYRFHQLFRSFLLERLGVERFSLTEKYGDIALGFGKIEQAVVCYIIAGAKEKARDTITPAGRRLIGQGNWQTVERWLAGFSEDELAQNPWFSLYKAQIEVNRGLIYSGENWVNHALNAFIETDDKTGIAESRLLKAKILRYHGQYQDSLSLLKVAIPDLPQEEAREHFDPYLEESYTLMLCGRFTEAEEVLNRALKLAEQRGDTVLMTYFYEGLGTVAFAWGYYDRSMYYYRRSIAISPDKSLRNYYFQDSIGPIYNDWGELDRAYEYLSQSVCAKESFGMTEALPSAYCQLGNVLLDRGDLIDAEKNFRRALQLIDENGGDHFVHTLTLFLLSICLGAQGRVVEAQDISEKTHAQAGNQSEYLNGLFRVVGCVFLLQTGDFEAAYQSLNEILPKLERVGARKLICVAYCALSLLMLKRDEETGAADMAVKALELSSQMNFAHDFLLFYNLYQPLLRFGLENGTEVTFIQRIMVKLSNRAVPLLNQLAEHPDPAVRLRILNPLAQIRDTGTLRVIQKLSCDTSPKVAQAACRLLNISGISNGFLHEPAGENRFIRLELFGPVSLFFGDIKINNINWIRSKSRDLLIYLAHMENPVDKDHIIEALWPEAPYQQANTLFHTNMHTLRSVLKSYGIDMDLVLYKGGRYYLSPGSIVTDKQEFLELQAAAGHSSRLNEPLVSFLEKAVALYRGDYLAELDYSWAISEQEYLKRLHNNIRDRLSMYYCDKKDYFQARIHLECLVRENPLTEEYYIRLFSVCAEIGDIKSIGMHYQRLKAALKDELGLSPLKDTQNLYYRLMNSR